MAPAGVQLGENAVEAKLLLQCMQLLGDPLRRADDDLAADRIVVGQMVERRGALDTAVASRGAGTPGRGPQPRRLLAKEVHDARLRLRPRPLGGLADIDRHPQIDPAMPAMAGLA